MHKYLSAAGFSNIKSRAEYENLIKACAAGATERAYTSNSENTMFAMFSKDFAPGIGLAVCGEYDEAGNFNYDYSFPYLKGEGISSYEDLTVERHADKESYAGICDDIKVGITLIFYLQNVVPYMRAKNTDKLPIKGTSLTLSAMSVHGTIVMPLEKNELVREKARQEKNSRNRLMEAARNGDEQAIENLTLDDMDTYSSLSKRVQREDIYTIVDTFFMPYGVECDQYSILAEILECGKVNNALTGEVIYKLKLLCNELTFDLCINEKDLYGEPDVGRRFKGLIWLQGFINFP